MFIVLLIQKDTHTHSAVEEDISQHANVLIILVQYRSDQGYEKV